MFRLWVAITVGFYAVRAFFATSWVGAIPGYILLLMVLASLLLASLALMFPGRVTPFRMGEPSWWGELTEDWGYWWRRFTGGGL